MIPVTDVVGSTELSQRLFSEVADAAGTLVAASPTRIANLHIGVTVTFARAL